MCTVQSVEPRSTERRRYLRRRRIDLFLRPLSLGLVPLGHQPKSKQPKSSLRSGAGGADTLSSAGVLGSSWCCSSLSALLGRWVAVVEEVKSRLRVGLAKRTTRARALAVLPPTV